MVPTISCSISHLFFPETTLYVLTREFHNNMIALHSHLHAKTLWCSIQFCSKLTYWNGCSWTCLKSSSYLLLTWCTNLSLLLESIILLLCFLSVPLELSTNGLVFNGGSGFPAPVDASTIWFTISSTSLILGRDFGFLTTHRLATAASFWADFSWYCPFSLGSTISWNFFVFDRYGFIHSKSFCSLLGRFLSKGSLPVMSSYRKTP